MIKKISLDEPTQVNNQQEQDTTMSSLESMPTKSGKNPKTIRLFSISLAVVAGLVVGFVLAQNKLSQSGIVTESGKQLQQNPTDAASVNVGDVFGSTDAESFSDSATGIIQPGGIDGEGTHHLERGLDKSQWVYLTSSVIDLDLFTTTEVELWGETFQGKKAGWLMDVGRLKVIKLNAAEINNIETSE